MNNFDLGQEVLKSLILLEFGTKTFLIQSKNFKKIAGILIMDRYLKY